MKLNFFLSVVSIFIVFHLCKAVPLRHLQKRAAFYIANETACVVDNIVYTSGDPIPTDDPCEACRCRPPGFACVLKECKVKPGCRAVRHAGECCPEYICGCEHNGKFYKDGDEIKDPKNPCYQCYCQGSSIACAFVDCIYRDECDSVFVPGECCPQYINCTRDIPDRNLFLGGGNVFPPINLLPVFNDESFLPEISSTDQAVEQPENPTNPTQPEESNETSEKEVTPEDRISEDVSSKSVTVEPESLVTEEKSLNTEVEEKDAETLESTEEAKQDLPKEVEDKEAVESSGETKTLLNSETDVNKTDDEKNSESQNLELTTESVKIVQTTVGSKLEETVNETEVTEKPLETESPSTEVTEKNPQIKNSASENSKSLKLTDTDQLEKEKGNQQDMKSDMKTEEKAITEQEQASESTRVISDIKESSTTENRLPLEENAEKSQENLQATPLNINNAKIKSESAETVTIVVHVKESSKIPTETDFIAETVTPVPITKVSEENLLKSNDDDIDTKKESSETEASKSTNKHFEIFATTKQTNEIELTSKSPSTDQNAEDIQGKSDEADNIAMEAEENPVSEPDPKTSDSNSGNDSLIIASTVSVIEDHKEVRTNEEKIDGTKADEPTITVLKIDTSRPITIKIVTDSTGSPKLELPTTELENDKTEDITEEKEIKNEKPKEIVEAGPELRSDTVDLKEKTEEATTVQSKEESIKEENPTQAEKAESTTEKETPVPEEKVQESTETNVDDKPEIRTNDETVTEKIEEKTNIENVEEKQTEESKSEITTESKTQDTEEPKQTTVSDN